jgi:DegV family protein with EDD domain
MKIAIVTDSTADLPADLANEYKVCVIPAILIIGDKSYEDGEDISRLEFYEKLPTMAKSPTTAAPSSGKFHQCYDQLIKNGAEKIISIHVSGKLSGIINSAQAAAHPFEDKVKIIDSGQVTLGLGFQVIEAARAALEGNQIDQILDRVMNIRQRVRLVALLDTLEYLRRSGRVSWARANLGSLLQIKPLVELIDGVVYHQGEVRTRKKGIDRLLKLLSETEPYEQIAILHTNAEEDALHLADVLLPKLDNSPLIVNVTTVIGTHVGPNGLGFVVLKND